MSSSAKWFLVFLVVVVTVMAKPHHVPGHEHPHPHMPADEIEKELEITETMTTTMNETARNETDNGDLERFGGLHPTDPYGGSNYNAGYECGTKCSHHMERCKVQCKRTPISYSCAACMGVPWDICYKCFKTYGYRPALNKY